MVAIIIQARTGSTRFEEKVLKKIYNQYSILDLIINNLKELGQKIIIATTSNESDKKIVSKALEYHLDYYCGSENNVLKRFIDCAHKFHISKFLRICSDNVFIQLEFLSNLIENSNSDYDYISYKIGSKNAILTHWGLFGELVTLNALEKVQKRTKDQKDLEHVTYYIYNHPDEFKIKYIDAPKKLLREDIRLTIDTYEDFQICREIIEYLEKNKLKWSYKNILEYLDDNKYLLEKMVFNIENNEKS